MNIKPIFGPLLVADQQPSTSFYFFMLISDQRWQEDITHCNGSPFQNHQCRFRRIWRYYKNNLPVCCKVARPWLVADQRSFISFYFFMLISDQHWREISIAAYRLSWQNR
ncbi:MAG: hypothetical protein ABI691_21245 [Ginsengibacter sp.]